MTYAISVLQCRQEGARLEGRVQCLGCGRCFYCAPPRWLCFDCEKLLNPPRPRRRPKPIVGPGRGDEYNSFWRPEDPFYWRGYTGGCCRLNYCRGFLKLVEETQLTETRYLLGYECPSCTDFTTREVSIAW